MDSGFGSGQEGGSRMDGARLQFSGTTASCQRRVVFDRPALPHQTQQRLWAGAQCGDEQVDMVKRLAVTPAGAHQLNNPAGTQPPLSNSVNGIIGHSKAP